jgi:hypothetical protein
VLLVLKLNEGQKCNSKKNYIGIMESFKNRVTLDKNYQASWLKTKDLISDRKKSVSVKMTNNVICHAFKTCDKTFSFL